MAGNIHAWSLTAADNDDADTTINWAEGQLPSTVNNSARAMMATLATFYKDNNGSLTLGGTPAAYTAAVNGTPAALATGLRLRAKATTASISSATLTVTPSGASAFAAKHIRQFAGDATDIALLAGEIDAGRMHDFVYDADANSAAGAWIIQNPSFKVGSFTPGVAFNALTTGITYGSRTGQYYRIGRLVFFSLNIALSSNGSATGAWTVTGLPFTADSATNVPVSVWLSAVNFNVDSETYAFVTAGGTTIQFWERFADASPDTTAAMTDTWTTDGTTIYVSGCYLAATS
jgi:hypothetical protein